MVTLQLLEDWKIELPREAVLELGIKKGDFLECIYGSRQIGLAPIRETGRDGAVFPPKNPDQMLWKFFPVL